MSGLLASGTFGGHAAESKAASAACWENGGAPPSSATWVLAGARRHELASGRLEERGGDEEVGGATAITMIWFILGPETTNEYRQLFHSQKTHLHLCLCLCVCVCVCVIGMWRLWGCHSIECSFINSSVSVMKGFHRTTQWLHVWIQSFSSVIYVSNEHNAAQSLKYNDDFHNKACLYRCTMCV